MDGFIAGLTIAVAIPGMVVVATFIVAWCEFH